MSLLEDTVKQNAQACPVCGGLAPCRGCSDNAEDPGVFLKDDTLKVILPVDDNGHGATEMGAEMLRMRGYDPDEWEESTLTVNDWDSQVAGGYRMTMHQTKITYRRKQRLEDSPIFKYMQWVESRPQPQFEALPSLKPTGAPMRLVALGDHQAPYVNWPLHELACEMLQDIEPDGIIYMGDGPDFDSISRHRKKLGTEFLSTVQEGVDSMYRILSELVQAAGCINGFNAYLIGNHDVRIETVVTDKVPDLFGVRRADMPDEPPVLSIPHLLRLGELGFVTVTDSKGDYPHGRVVLSEGNDSIPPLIASHGWIARKGAGNSARHSIDNLNASIVVGHTHRLALSHVTRWHETGDGQEPRIYTAVETGVMADGKGLGYSRYPDWQPGFAVIDIYPNSDYSINLATVRDNVLTWGGQTWTRTATGVKRS